MFIIIFCHGLDSNFGLLVSEATALSTVLQPLQHKFIKFYIKNKNRFLLNNLHQSLAEVEAQIFFRLFVSVHSGLASWP